MAREDIVPEEPRRATRGTAKPVRALIDLDHDHLLRISGHVKAAGIPIAKTRSAKDWPGEAVRRLCGALGTVFVQAY